MTTYNLHHQNNTQGDPSPDTIGIAAELGRQLSSPEFSRSWSDVVANRSPSPPQGQEMYPDVQASAGMAIERNVSESDKASRKSSEEEENPNPWVKVTRRRSKSLEYPRRNKTIFTQKPQVEFDPVIDAAERQLTNEQRLNIQKQYGQVARKPSAETRGEGASKTKGKGANSTNWGNAGIPNREQNIDVQAAELRHYQLLKEQAQKKTYNQKNNEVTKEPRAKKARRDKPVSERCSQTPALSTLAEQRLQDIAKQRYDQRAIKTTARKAEINPVEQVASKSYLGQAPKNSCKAEKRRRPASLRGSNEARTSSRFPEKKDRGQLKPALSDKEQNELLAAGKCFCCKETGHVAQQCSKGTFIRSDKSGKPPEVPSFGIDVAMDEAELFQELASTTETLYGVGVGSISFDLETHP
ncbi:hypothetical protein H0H92_004680 [Tricholoma furcatifolium]|nr:hypothetical protein H0H92_004680 [Tricholoma furcatifolium]